MNDAAALPKNAQVRIGKQIMLPWSKAFEIALKSIRVRFWRSMITMSSIILAIAFLMSIWTSTAITAALDLGPQARMDALKAQLAVVRQAIEGKAGAPSKAEIEKRFARELAAARRLKEQTIREKQRAIEGAASDEAKKLAAEVDGLNAQLAGDKSLELLRDYLAAERQEVEAVKGRLAPILLQERGGREEEPTEGAPPKGKEAPVAPATGGAGGLSGFLAYMSPTDRWLAVLALLVCFVGIVNAMFMTVQERFREIGTMKCLGALDAFIVKIFLIESAMLGLIGTVAGILVGFVLSTLRQWIVYGGATWAYLSFGSIFVAALMAALVGLVLSIVAAIFPARRAARMEPVAAMRTEE